MSKITEKVAARRSGPSSTAKSRAILVEGVPTKNFPSEAMRAAKEVALSSVKPSRLYPDVSKKRRELFAKAVREYYGVK